MFRYITITGLMLTSLVYLNSVAQVQAQDNPERNMLPDPEVLEQGPLHEAFAEPLTFGEQEPLIVSKKPPQPIQEIPPDQRPEGRNVEWIPGYFHFDQEREDFIWVSGLYRDVPPGRAWVPGEWQEVDKGWQWVPGFWSEADQDLSLLPQPPASLETGPTSPAPGDDYLWAPGTWKWQGDGYAWQAGFWYQAQDNWVWVPNHYCYTPQGSVFVNGYWDYPVQSRGWLYAPVYWSSGFGGYGRNYYYRPASLINTGLLLANLFVNNRYGGYYYGYNRGAYPGWLQPWGRNFGNWGYYGRGGRGNFGGYDPLWAHYRWHDHHRGGRGRDGWDNDRDWDRDRDFDRNGRGDRDRDNRDGDRLADDLRDRVDRDRSDRDAEGRDQRVRDRDLITTPDELINREGNRRRIEQLSENEVDRVRRQAERYRNFDRSRVGLDSQAEANINANRVNRRANVDGDTTVQGRILRQGDDNTLQGNRRGQGNVDLGSRNRGDRNQGDIEARFGGRNQTQINQRDLNSRIRSDTQVENRARVQREGRSLNLDNSTQLRSNVNERATGNRLNDGSNRTGRQELFYRGSPQQGNQQQLQQRLRQNVPSTRSLQDAIPQGNIRRGNPSNSSSNRVYQGRGNQGSQRMIQQSRSAPQNSGNFRGGGNRGGANQAAGGNRGGGGGGGRGGGGGKGRGR